MQGNAIGKRKLKNLHRKGMRYTSYTRVIVYK